MNITILHRFVIYFFIFGYSFGENISEDKYSNPNPSSKVEEIGNVVAKEEVSVDTTSPIEELRRSDEEGSSQVGSSSSPSIGVLPGKGESKMIPHSLKIEKKIKKDASNEVTSSDKSKVPVMQNNTEVVAQVGGTATLSCYTGHISDEVVTWLKREDDQLLTIGQELYANEDRFSASLSHASKAWELFVRDVQLSDAGHYECQLTTHPPVTFLYSLKVTQAVAEIRGPKEVHIEEGSQLDLQCYVKDSPSPPVYIFWYHNGSMVNYERQRGLQVHLENFMSSLVVGKVTPSDAGVYTCDPHLATRASVIVHVVTGEKPAAMQHGRNQVESSASFHKDRISSVIFILFIFVANVLFLRVEGHIHLSEENSLFYQTSTSNVEHLGSITYFNEV